MDEERKRLIDKISKLLTLSEDSAAFEGERETARRKCGELLAKYSLKLNELGNEKSIEIRKIETFRKRINHNEFSLYGAIGEFCGCLVTSPKSTDNKESRQIYKLIGRHPDIESAVYLFEVINRQIQFLTSEYKAQCKKYKKSCKSYNYIQGLCCGVKDRMKEIFNEVLRYQQEEGLIPVNIFKQRRNEAEEWLKKNHKIIVVGSKSVFNDSTYDGIYDAKRIIIHAPVGKMINETQAIC